MALSLFVNNKKGVLRRYRQSKMRDNKRLATNLRTTAERMSYIILGRHDHAEGHGPSMISYHHCPYPRWITGKHARRSLGDRVCIAQS